MHELYVYVRYHRNRHSNIFVQKVVVLEAFEVLKNFYVTLLISGHAYKPSQ